MKPFKEFIEEAEQKDAARIRVAKREAGIRAAYRLAKVEEVEQTHAPVAPAPRIHLIKVTVSDPDHPVVSKRKETKQEFYRFMQYRAHPANSAAAKKEAIARAENHFKKKRYTVHGVEHLGIKYEGINETVLNPKDPHGDYEAKMKVLNHPSTLAGAGSTAVRQAIRDLNKEYGKYKK